MWLRTREAIAGKVSAWLRQKMPRDGLPLTDFTQLRQELRPGDVLLVEGRSRVARTISQVTLSPWTHAALYIGRLDELSPTVSEQLKHALPTDAGSAELLLEAELGLGTLIRPLSAYQDEHLRICRPGGLSADEVQIVIENALKDLGKEYDVRQIFDLARFFFPYALLPRRWRSSLFEHNAGDPTRVVCSSMLARAFASVKYPIVPTLRLNEAGKVEAWPRNTKLITPKDFDYSPYFQIIKYAYLGFDNIGTYRDITWQEDSPDA